MFSWFLWNKSQRYKFGSRGNNTRVRFTFRPFGAHQLCNFCSNKFAEIRLTYHNGVFFLSPHPLHRIEFGPSKFFPKLANFPSYLTQPCNFSGGATFEKHADPEKKESKQSEITCKQAEPIITISKIQKRREFVRAFCYEQCPKNSFKRLYIVKGLLVLVEKTSFSKEFRWKFQCGGEVQEGKGVLPPRKLATLGGCQNNKIESQNL